MGDKRGANEIDKRLGDRVRRRRLELGMSQEHLAGRLGVTFQQVQKYEKGVNRIAASRLLEVSRALDVPVARFFEGLASAPEGARRGAQRSSIERALATPEGVQLMTIFSAIPNTKIRKKLLAVAQALADETGVATDSKKK